MAKQPTRILSGIHPYVDKYFKITLYDDGSIRIERPWCLLDPRIEWPVLEEDHWQLHKHLIGLIETRTITDKRY